MVQTRTRAPVPGAAGATAIPGQITTVFLGGRSAFKLKFLPVIVAALLVLNPTGVLSAATVDEEHGEENDNSHGDEPHGNEGDDHGEESHESHEAYAVLFPWFTQAMGIFVFLLLTRKLHALPYTAVMFIVGTFMGVGASENEQVDDQLSQSILQWTGIDGEVVLLVFLPGLLFWDALDVNFYLFRASFWQLVIMAFPMVLAGTTLTALVGYYIFPYGWSFMLSMTFGAILAATDPVAVASLLNEVGAPPRIKMHVSGESLLNDGSAVVFYTIFSKLFLYELDIGLGQQFTVGEGFALFFRMSLGGAAIGVGFGLGLLLLLFYLNRRLENEENVLQVAATITVAYLSFYVAEVTCGTSGVISVVMCGITTHAFGSGLINDRHVLESFWHLVEHLLNTLLFTLGGVVWGELIARQWFDATDVGYLFLLYVFVQAIRFFLVFAFYPILSRIGLKTNWQEAVFLSFGGLRGAVGIALALLVDHNVYANSEEVEHRTYTNKLFIMVGGIALLTLLINGTLAGPLLRRLGLAKSSDSRNKVVGNIQEKIRDYILDRFIHLLTDPRFFDVEFAVVRYHVPLLESLTVEELRAAVEQNKKNVPSAIYEKPVLKNVLPYLEGADASSSLKLSTFNEDDSTTGNDEEALTQSWSSTAAMTRNPRLFNLGKELRLTFLELVHAAYIEMVEKGELESGSGFVVYALEQSIDIAADRVSKGSPLCDWEESRLASTGWVDAASGSIRRAFSLNWCRKKKGDERSTTAEYLRLRNDVLHALAFITAHQKAQQRFVSDFSESSDDFKSAAQLVFQESEDQVAQAEELLSSLNQKDVKGIVSHFFCVILLNKTARFVNSLATSGLLKPTEAYELYIEQIEEALHYIQHCSIHEHPGMSVESDNGAVGDEEYKRFSVLLISRMRKKSMVVLHKADAFVEE